MRALILAFIAGRKRRAAVVGAGVVAAAALAWVLLAGPNGDGVVYRTAKVERGSVTRMVSASGKLGARVSVTVSSQLSGKIREVLVDYNSPVKAGGAARFRTRLQAQ